MVTFSVTPMLPCLRLIKFLSSLSFIVVSSVAVPDSVTPTVEPLVELDVLESDRSPTAELELNPKRFVVPPSLPLAVVLVVVELVPLVALSLSIVL